jgi:hypothetical protein
MEYLTFQDGLPATPSWRTKLYERLILTDETKLRSIEDVIENLSRLLENTDGTQVMNMSPMTYGTYARGFSILHPIPLGDTFIMNTIV